MVRTADVTGSADESQRRVGRASSVGYAQWIIEARGRRFVADHRRQTPGSRQRRVRPPLIRPSPPVHVFTRSSASAFTIVLMATGFWSRVRRYYLAGILVLAPTAITLWVVWSLFLFFDNILGNELRARGISVVGLGFVLLNAVLLVLGWLATNLLGRRVFALWDRLMHSVPLVNKI